MLNQAALIDLLDTHGANSLDVRFTDLLGRWRHLSVSGQAVREAASLQRLLMIDGSSLPGWRDVAQSELMLWPQPETAWADPFTPQPTAICVADVVDPATTGGYDRCPRSALARTLEHLKAARLCDSVQIGVDLAFHLFDGLDVSPSGEALGYRVEQRAARPALEPAYLALPPRDHFGDLRAEMVNVLERLGLPGLCHLQMRDWGHSEIKFGPGPAMDVADQIQLARYAIENVAQSYGKVASFLPYPMPDRPSTWLHLHVSWWKGDRPVFAGQGYADLSETCLQAIGGVLTHARALNAFTNPTTNSYRRLRHTDREPVLLTFGAHNRSTAIRIPAAARREDKRLELRFPDPQANPYLAISAICLAMADGVTRKLDPGEPMDRNLYDLNAASVSEIGRCAPSLLAALDELERVLEPFDGEALPQSLILAYIACKRDEVDVVEKHPHPIEYALYG